MKWLKKVPLNKRNPLEGEELKYVLVSSMQAIRNDAYINSYETGLDSSKRVQILDDFQKKYHNKTIIEILDDYAREDLQPFFYEMYGLYEKRHPFLEQIIYDQLGAIKAQKTVEIFHNLSTKINQLKKFNIINEDDEIKRVHFSAWNSSLGAFIARLMYEEKMISISEMKKYLKRFYKSVKKSVNSWEEFGKSVMVMRVLYYDDVRNKTDLPEKFLLENNNSPFRQISF